MRFNATKSRTSTTHQGSSAAAHTSQADTAGSATLTTTVSGHHPQPLQARSSNSGTSMKRSDNVSQSSYPAGELASSSANAGGEKAAFTGWAKSNERTASGSRQQQLAVPPGHLTNAFAQGTGSNGATNTKKNTCDPTVTSGSGRDTRRNGHSKKGSTQNVPTSEGGSGIEKRGQTRSTRSSLQRAVKESATVGATITEDFACAKSEAVVAPGTPASEISDVRGSLRPVKQTQSETRAAMRTTRSRSKASQHPFEGEETDDKQAVCSEAPLAHQSENICNAVGAQEAHGQVSNGQKQIESRNLEKMAALSLNAKPAKAHQAAEAFASQQAWPHEDSKQLEEGMSRSGGVLNSSGLGKSVNQSFQLINDSADSLMENPLCSVIKQYQTQRNNALLTGKNKPTIQQFLEKFQKEMHSLEDQYQAQQQAREEQMRLFELHYGAAASQTSKPPTDNFSRKVHAQLAPQPPQGDKPTDSAGFAAVPFDSDAQMAQDGTIANRFTTSVQHQQQQQFVDQGNTSFHSALHGPNNALTGSFFGGASDTTQQMHEIYEGFQFSQNAMVSFYPRQVRKILSRRKTSNSASQIMSEIRDLKPPKHKTKVQKSIQRMHGLAVTQMNFMQVLLQKVSRRSKVIRKQEKIVNDNLKRKRIYLEKEGFDLMTVLRQSLQAAESTTQAGKGAHSATQIPQLTTSLAQKQPKPRKATASDLHSRCPSTAGTKSGVDQPLTQSVRGSTMAPPYGEENASMDGFQSRKHNRVLSGAENCLSQPESAPLHSQLINRQPVELQRNQAQTPEPPTKATPKNQEQLQSAEEKVQQAVNQSNIDDQFLSLSGHRLILAAPTNMAAATGASLIKSGVALPHSFGQNQPLTEPSLHDSHTPQKEQGLSMRSRLGGAQVLRHSETPMFDYEQHHPAALEAQPDALMADYCSGKAEAAFKKGHHYQTSGPRNGKKKSALTAFEREQIQKANSSAMNFQDRLLAAAESGFEGDKGGFAIANLDRQAADQTQLTAAVPESKSTKGPEKQTSERATQGKSAKSRRSTKALTKQASTVTITLSAGETQSQKRQSSKQAPQESQSEQQAVLNARNQEQQESPSLKDKQKNKKQRKEKSPDHQIDVTAPAHSHHVEQYLQEPPQEHAPLAQHFMSSVAPMGVDMGAFYGHHGGLSLINASDDHPMQSDHFMMATDRQGLFPEDGPLRGGAATVSHDQPVVTDLSAMHHRGQQVLLPHHHHHHHHHHSGGPIFDLPHDHPGLLDPVGVSANHHHHDDVLRGFVGQADDFQNDNSAQAGEQGRSKAKKSVSNMIDPIFDESVQDLSSIVEHSAAAVDNFNGEQAYESGFNPYEQAKRQQLKKQQSQHAEAAAKAAQRQGDQHLKVPGAMRNHFVSPITAALQDDQHTANLGAHQDAGQDHHGALMGEAGASTPTQFMSGVDVNHLGRGPGLDGQKHGNGVLFSGGVPVREPQQLSVARLCTNQFNMSGSAFVANHAFDDSAREARDAHQNHHGHLQGNYGNTPAGLLSNSQAAAVLAESHRQHLTVSRWNLDGPSAADAAASSSQDRPAFEVHPHQYM